MKVFFDVVGCRLNQGEVEYLANIFRSLDHQIVSNPAEADLAIINSCAVTVKAAADSRKKLRRAAREGAKKVVATGCWATLYPQQASDLEGVTDVFSNEEKDQIPFVLLDLPADILEDLKLVRDLLPGERGRTRAFIKVQEGCDNTCTYCLTRLARGKSTSRNLDVIQRDLLAARDGGAKEIVLSGVQLGAWGRDLPDRKNLYFSSWYPEKLSLSSWVCHTPLSKENPSLKNRGSLPTHGKVSAVRNRDRHPTRAALIKTSIIIEVFRIFFTTKSSSRLIQYGYYILPAAG